METDTSDSVSINMEVFGEPSNLSPADISDVRGDTVLSTERLPSGARDRQATSSCDTRTGDSQGPSVDIEEIELIDMRCRIDIDGSQRELLEGGQRSPSNTRADPHLYKSPADKEGNGNSGRLVTPTRQLNTPGSPGRPALLNDQSLASESGVLLSPVRHRSNSASPRRIVSPNDQSKSTLSVPGQPWKNQAGQMKSKNRVRMGSAQSGDEYDDDDDISMSSLMELLGTVRQYAKEIHEIYAPIKKDEEERIRKQNEQNARRRSKEKGKNLVCRSNSEVTAPTKHEVRVEIHSPENIQMEDLRQRRSKQPKHEVLLHSKSHEPLSSANQTASLHVENEKLPSTWPRGNRSATSRERFWSDVNTDSSKSQRPRGSMPRPQIPPSWSAMSRIQRGDESLQQTPQRSRKTNIQPPVNTNTKSNISSQKMPIRPSQNRVPHPAAEDHRMPQQGLPQISIIPASFDYKTPNSESAGGSLPSGFLDNYDPTFRSTTGAGKSHGDTIAVGKLQCDTIIPTAPVIFRSDLSIARPPGSPQDGADAVKSRAGLRKRKSVDTGLGQHVVVLEKY
ncbi:hypothetical protein BsWGS_19612 [Bradybaena similaris]